MALIFKGKTTCGLCGKLLAGKDIVGLPAIADVTHELYVYFDQGFHSRCFDNWDKKKEVMEVLEAEKKLFHQSSYYKVMFEKYGNPGP
ncbi:MAG: hypothetical protein H7Y86_04940 [Rhizobacter sp.]|nr:hypothetical protein [Ferruginibacter sp.]